MTDEKLMRPEARHHGRRQPGPVAYRAVMTAATTLGFIYIVGRLSALGEGGMAICTALLVFAQLTTQMYESDRQRVCAGLVRTAKLNGGGITLVAARAHVSAEISDSTLRRCLRELEESSALLRHCNAQGLEWWSLPRLEDVDDLALSIAEDRGTIPELPVRDFPPQSPRVQ